MDDYDPACPTEDDNPPLVPEIDLSQVPLPPSPATVTRSTRRSAQPPLPPPPVIEPEKMGGRRKKKKKKKKGNERTRSLAEVDDDEEEEDVEAAPKEGRLAGSNREYWPEANKEGQRLEPISGSSPATVASPGHQESSRSAEQPPPPPLQPPPPSSSLSSSQAAGSPVQRITRSTLSSTQASLTPTSAPSSTSGMLQFKLKTDPDSGKSKVSFQLKKSLYSSAFRAAESDDDDDDDKKDEEEGHELGKAVEDKEIIEKTSAGEYVPTRFKVSKKHEMYRPNSDVNNVTVVFTSSQVAPNIPASTNQGLLPSPAPPPPPLNVVTTNTSEHMNDTSSPIGAKVEESTEERSGSIGQTIVEENDKLCSDDKNGKGQDSFQTNHQKSDGSRRGERMRRRVDTDVEKEIEAKNEEERSSFTKESKSERSRNAEERLRGRNNKSEKTGRLKDEEVRESRSKRTDREKDDGRRRSSRYRTDAEDGDSNRLSSRGDKREREDKKKNDDSNTSRRLSRRGGKEESPPRRYSGRRTRNNSRRSRSNSRDRRGRRSNSGSPTPGTPPRHQPQAPAVSEKEVDQRQSDSGKSAGKGELETDHSQRKSGKKSATAEFSGVKLDGEKVEMEQSDFKTGENIVGQGIEAGDLQLETLPDGKKPAKETGGGEVETEQPHSVSSKESGGKETELDECQDEPETRRRIASEEAEITQTQIEPKKSILDREVIDSPSQIEPVIFMPNNGKSKEPEIVAESQSIEKLDVKRDACSADAGIVYTHSIDADDSQSDGRHSSPDTKHSHSEGKMTAKRVQYSSSEDDEKGEQIRERKKRDIIEQDSKFRNKHERYSQVGSGDRPHSGLKFSSSPLTSQKRETEKKVQASYSQIFEPALPPEQVLVDISALPGKSKWELEDEEEKEVEKEQDDRLRNVDRRDEERNRRTSQYNMLLPLGRESRNRLVSGGDLRRQTRSGRRPSRGPESSSNNEEELNTEHKKHRDKKLHKDHVKAPKKSKKKKKRHESSNGEDNIDSSEQDKKESQLPAKHWAKKQAKQDRSVSKEVPLDLAMKEYTPPPSTDSRNQERNQQRNEESASKISQVDEYSGIEKEGGIEEHKKVGVEEKKEFLPDGKDIYSESETVKLSTDTLTSSVLCAVQSESVDEEQPLCKKLEDETANLAELSGIQADCGEDNAGEKDVELTGVVERRPGETDAAENCSVSSSKGGDVVEKGAEKEERNVSKHATRSLSRDRMERSVSKSSQPGRDRRERSKSSERSRKSNRGNSSSLTRRGRSRSPARHNKSRSSGRRDRSRSLGKREKLRSPARRERSRSLGKRDRSRSSSRRNRSRSVERRKDSRRSRSKSPSRSRRGRSSKGRSGSPPLEQKNRERRRRSRSRSNDRSYSHKRQRSPDIYGRDRKVYNRRERLRSESSERLSRRRRRRDDSQDRAVASPRRDRNRRRSNSCDSHEKIVMSNKGEVKGSSPESCNKEGDASSAVVLDLSSIPIPGEIPQVTDDATSKAVDRIEIKDSPEFRDSEHVDIVEEAPMEISDDEGGSLSGDEKVTSALPEKEKLNKPHIPKATPESLKSSRTETSAKNAPPSQSNYNLGSQDRQIKFSISGFSRKLQPVIVSSILDDDLEEKTVKGKLPKYGNEEKELQQQTKSLRALSAYEEKSEPIKSEVDHILVEATSISDTGKRLEEKGEVLEKDSVSLEESTSRKLGKVSSEVTIVKTETNSAEADAESLKMDSDSVNSKLKTECLDFTEVVQKSAGKNSEKTEDAGEPVETSHESLDVAPEFGDVITESTQAIVQTAEVISKAEQPQRLKFKYIPLWEMEGKNQKPQSLLDEEEKLRKSKKSFSLALGYGSESSDDDECEPSPTKKDKLNSKEKENAEENTVKEKIEHESVSSELEKEIEEGKLKELQLKANAAVSRGETEESHKLGQEEIASYSMNPKQIADVIFGKDQLLEKETEVVVSHSEAVSGNVKLPPLSHEEEAYSPSHPSLEELEPEPSLEISEKQNRINSGNVDIPVEHGSNPSAIPPPSSGTIISPTTSSNGGVTTSLPAAPNIWLPDSSQMTTSVPRMVPPPQGVLPPAAGSLMVPGIKPTDTQTLPGTLSAPSSLLTLAGQVPQPVPPPPVVAHIPMPGLPPLPVPPPAVAPVIQSIPLPGAKLPLQGAPPLPIPAVKTAPASAISSLAATTPYLTPGTMGIPLPVPAPVISTTPLTESVHQAASKLAWGTPAPPDLLSSSATPKAVISGAIPQQTILQGTSQSVSALGLNQGQASDAVGPSLSQTPPLRFRVSRFHQGPQGVQALPVPPPSVSLPSLQSQPAGTTTSASAWGTPAVVSSTSLPTVTAALQKCASSVTTQGTISGTFVSATSEDSQVKPIMKSSSNTGVKRPRISSILSQPKIDDLKTLECLGIKATGKPSGEKLSTTTDKPSETVAVEATVNPGMVTEKLEDISAKKEVETVAQQLSQSLQQAAVESMKSVSHIKEAKDSLSLSSKDSTDIVVEAEVPVSAKGKHSTVQQPQLVHRSHTKEMQEIPAPKSSSQQSTSNEAVATTEILDMGSIPLPSSPPKKEKKIMLSSSTPTQLTPSPPEKPPPSTAAAPPLPSKQAPPLPPHPPVQAEQPVLPAVLPDSSTAPVVSSKSQTLGSLLAERKKRFTQSPLAIGMLPKITSQSPLSIGPLPIIPPEPTTSSGQGPREVEKVSGTIMPMSLSKPKKGKTVQEDKDRLPSSSRIHIVLKAKSAAIQKTVVPGFEDEASDDSNDEHGTSLSTLMSSDSITSQAPESREGEEEEEFSTAAVVSGHPLVPSVTEASSDVAAAPILSVCTETHTASRASSGKDSQHSAAARVKTPASKERTQVVSLTDIEAFPVQVITSSRELEKTRASVWPEFTAGLRLGQGGEEVSRDSAVSREKMKEDRRSGRDEREEERRRADDRDRRWDSEKDRRKRKNYHDDEADGDDDRRGSRGHRRDLSPDSERVLRKIKKEKDDDDDYYQRKSGGDREKKSSRRRDEGYSDADDDEYDSRKSKGRKSDDGLVDRRRSRHVDEDDANSKRKRGKSRDKDRKWRRYEDDENEEDNRKIKHSERDRDHDRSRDRDHNRDKDKSWDRERGSKPSRSSGKHSRRNRSQSHSPSPIRKRERSRDRYENTRDRERSRSRSLSHERDRKGRDRKKDTRSFKEDLLEEFGGSFDFRSSSNLDVRESTLKVVDLGSSTIPTYPTEGDLSQYVPDQSHAFLVDTNYSMEPLAYPPSQPITSTEPSHPSYDSAYSSQYPPVYDTPQYVSVSETPPYSTIPSNWHNQHGHVPVVSQQPQPTDVTAPPLYPTDHQHYQYLNPHPHPQQVYPAQTPPNVPYSMAQPAADPFHPQASHLPVRAPTPHIVMEQQGQAPPPAVCSVYVTTPQQQDVYVTTPQQQDVYVTTPQQQDVYVTTPQQQHLPQYSNSGPYPQGVEGPTTFQHKPQPPFSSASEMRFNIQQPNFTRVPLNVRPPIRSPLLKPPPLSRSGPDVSSLSGPRFPAPDIQPSRKTDLKVPRKSRFIDTDSSMQGIALQTPVVSTSVLPFISPPTAALVSLTKQPVPAGDIHTSLRAVVKKEPSFETSSLAEADFDSSVKLDVKLKLPRSEKKRNRNVLGEVNEPTVSSSGVEDSTGDTGSDSGTDSSQKPLKVKSRWRRNSEAEAVVETSTPPQGSTPPMPLSKQLLTRLSAISSSPVPEGSPSEPRRTRSQVPTEKSASAPGSAVPPVPPPRKRIRMEQEAGTSLESSDFQPNEVNSTAQPMEEPEDLASIVQRPDFPQFEIVAENIHLKERKKSKSMKRMVCDCTTSREERSRGIEACGADCLNRMLMIECGSRCPCGDHCTNKRFQGKKYAKALPFKAGEKGWGLRADEDMMERGTFIMEYVGELLDYEEFFRRTKQYSKVGLRHHYFMALNADEVVDATLRGSISRFINHSCDPNCETQKWTVNGELRVGFFTRKELKKGEELTFDYQFEHYGEPQKCYCGSENCRGYIGLVKSPPRNNKKKDKKKKEIFKDELLEEDIEKLSFLDGLRNKDHVLELCRLMVRAEKAQHRIAILKILQETTETTCLRLFLDYHGLSLFWSWMTDIGTVDCSEDTEELKILILTVLKSLPITNKTVLNESKILDAVERWAVAAVAAAIKPPPPPPPTSSVVETAPTTTPSVQAPDPVSGDLTAVATDAADSEPSTATDNEADAVLEPPVVLSSEGLLPSSSSSSPLTLPPAPGSAITPVSILTSAKDSKETKVKRRVTFAEVPVDAEFSPVAQDDEADEEEEYSNDISSSTQGVIQEEGEATISDDKDSSPSDESGDTKSTEASTSGIADSTSQKDDYDGTDADGDDMSDAMYLTKSPLAVLATELLAMWSTLKEIFKIPKKERVEERKRTERELDVLSKKAPRDTDPYAKWRRTHVRYPRRKLSAEEDDKKSLGPKMSKEERRQLFEAKVKAEDEMAAQAAAEEEQRQQEAYLAHLAEDPNFFLYSQQQMEMGYVPTDPGGMLCHEPSIDPTTGQPFPQKGLGVMDHGNGQPLFDPNTGQPLIDPNTGQPIMNPNLGQHLMDPNTGQPLIDPNTGQPIQTLHHHPSIDPNTGQALVHHVTDPQIGQAIPNLDLYTGQLIQQFDPHTGQPLQPPVEPAGIYPHIDPHTGHSIFPPQVDPHMAMTHSGDLTIDPHMGHPAVPDVMLDPHIGQPMQVHPSLGQTAPGYPHQASPQPHVLASTSQSGLSELDMEEEVPPPPSPPAVPVAKLPPNWKTAKDAEGKVYYYHAYTRQTQWEVPSWEENEEDSDNDMDLDPMPPEEVIKNKKTMTAAADTSSEVARKIKEHFRSKMSGFIVVYLNPYRKQDCKIGRISSTEDFKHLARKLTHHVMSKELKHCRHVEDLEVNENVKAKAKDYVRKYMSKFGAHYKKASSPQPDDSTV